MTADPFDLERFVSAQDGAYETALDELRSDRKRSHWMWFVFPQLKGLGFAPTAQHFRITSFAEAVAYLDHPVLGPRLAATTQAVQSSSAAALTLLFGSPDDVEFRSSTTPCAAVTPAGLYQASLDRWCDGEADQKTFQLLRADEEEVRG